MKYNDLFKKLDDLGSVGRGKSKHRPRNDESLYGGKYPFIQTGDVRKAEYYLTEFTQTYNEKGLAQSKLWNEGTLCITIAANIAETAVLGIKACFPDSIIGFMPYEDEADVRFVKYCLETYKLQMQAISKGATQDNLSLEKLRSLNFLIPKIEEQRRVANVLYSYDKLIENNSKRISILEEVTEQLYKEWFVRMRFPNYENVKFLKGIPENWRLETLDSVSKILKGKVVTKETVEEGIVPVVAGGLSPAYYHNKSNTKSPTITISASGANAGYVNLYFDDIWASDCSFIDTRASDFLYFTYLTLKVRQKEIYHLQQGSAQPHVYPKDIKRVGLFLPPKNLLKNFEELMIPIFEEIKNLNCQVQNLRKTRDLLLPRLMSGKLKFETTSKNEKTANLSN